LTTWRETGGVFKGFEKEKEMGKREKMRKGKGKMVRQKSHAYLELKNKNILSSQITEWPGTALGKLQVSIR
jgi:hypothetical protein